MKIAYFSMLITVFLSATSFANPKVYLPPLTVADSAKALETESLETEMAAAVSALSQMDVLTQKDIQTLLSVSAGQQMMGCDSIKCQTDTAKLLEVDFILRLEVALVQESPLLVGVVLSPLENRVVRRQMVRLPKGTSASRGIPILAGQLFGDGDASASVTAAHNDTGTVAGETSAARVVAQKNEEPIVTGSVLVMLSRAETALLDEAGYGAVERMAAEALGALEGITVMSNEEARDLMIQEANATQMGQDSSNVLAKVGAALKADYVLGMTIGDLGGAAAVTGSLVHTASAEVLTRGSLTMTDTTNIGGAAQVVALQLFGVDKELPPSPAQADRFDAKMKVLADQVSAAWAKSNTSALSRLAVMPFADVAAEAKVNNVGSEVGEFLKRGLGEALGKQMVSAKKHEELFSMKTKPLSEWTDGDFKESARFLGASHILTGEVKKLGNDFLIRAFIYDDISGEKKGAGHVFFPMGDPSKLITKAFVVRTKEEAIIRSLVPGFGQFYNGPKHRVKGFAVLAGTLAGLAGAVYGGLEASNTAAERILWDESWEDHPKFSANNPDRIVTNFDDLDTTEKEIAKGNEWDVPYLANACQSYYFENLQNPEGSPCYAEVQRLKEQEVQWQMIAIGSAAVSAGFYVWGIIDAYVYGEDYSSIMEE